MLFIMLKTLFTGLPYGICELIFDVRFVFIKMTRIFSYFVFQEFFLPNDVRKYLFSHSSVKRSLFFGKPTIFWLT